jgi:hypothetical protein
MFRCTIRDVLWLVAVVAMGTVHCTSNGIATNANER